MVNNFLCWKLPDNFMPDCGISFHGRNENGIKNHPIGTNLLTAPQAREMLLIVTKPMQDEIDQLRDELERISYRNECRHKQEPVVDWISD